MSDFWSWYIIILVVINIVGCGALLYFTRNLDSDVTEDGTTGHVYDGIKEYNKPLPRWWLYLFYLSILYSIGYLIVYPGMGNFAGTFGWTSAGQHQEEVVAAKVHYGPLFAKYAKTDIEELIDDEKAVIMGQRIFANTCFACHGSDARGASGYPNLTDNDWLYGSTPNDIKHSITNGRTGMMPASAAMFDEQGLKDIVAYVLSLSDRNSKEGDAETGKAKFMFCAACHGPEAKGNPLLGAPNLTDGVWLYGGSEKAIANTISKGRSGVMPAHKDILTAEQIHLVTAYIYSLSN
jgi:cytochrome c oxidase cbb3-type subunit 3